MSNHTKIYKLWYEFLCRSEPEGWCAEVQEIFGTEIIPVEDWWQKNFESFPETDKAEVSLIEDEGDFEPNDEFVINVAVYFHHSKPRIMKAFGKIIDAQHLKLKRIQEQEIQDKISRGISEEDIAKEMEIKKAEDKLIQVTNMPLYRLVNSDIIHSLETTLLVYDTYKLIEKEYDKLGIDKSPDLFEVWERANTKDRLTRKEDNPLKLSDKYELPDIKRQIRPKMSRYMKRADHIISNAKRGVFPSHHKDSKGPMLMKLNKARAIFYELYNK